MITGKISDAIPEWYPEALKKLIQIFKTTDFHKIDLGKHIVDGDNIFFVVDEYTTIEPKVARPEDHQIYADLQFIFRGEERFGVTLGNDTLVESEAYDIERDIRFYEPSNQYGRLHFKQGMYIIVMPEDVHVPRLDMPDGHREVRKVVGKIKVELLR
ncbi:MAG: YhcH/YjgK/YiaL family protein [Alphaproteobacteria bacterium]